MIRNNVESLPTSDGLMRSVGIHDKIIKPIRDELGEPINPNAEYDEAIDIIVDGKPRYEYVETDIDIPEQEPNQTID